MRDRPLHACLAAGLVAVVGGAVFGLVHLAGVGTTPAPPPAPLAATLAAPAEPPSCSIRRLPGGLIYRAARMATSLDPGNHPSEAVIEALPPGVDMPLAIAASTAKRWGSEPRTLAVQFLDGPSDSLKARILGHMNAWRCGVGFAEARGIGNVRITRSQAGYWSYLGTDCLQVPVGQPTMCLQGFTDQTSESEFRRVVRHETGHALGFPHEHMRREEVARLDPERTYAFYAATQGWSRQVVNEQVLTPLDERSLLGTPPDEQSIMCYAVPGSATRDGRPILGGADINESDRTFAWRLYPVPIAPDPPIDPRAKAPGGTGGAP
jgi:hypothetical protein